MVQPIVRRQPFKGLYLAYLVVLIPFVRVPWWFIRYLPRSRRPSPNWSILRCVVVALHREVANNVLAVQLGITGSVAPPRSDGQLKNAEFRWIEGISDNSEAFCGEVRRAASINGVVPAKVGAYWYFKPGASVHEDLKAREGESVALYIHGGAFHLGSAHPSSPTAATSSRAILEHSRALDRVLSVDYRLSATTPDPPANPFPAALLDALAAYQYLVKDAGFDPKNIIILGDSAGGNIAFSLVRHLVENDIPVLPPPGRLIAWSPWLDISGSRNGPDSSLVQNREKDIITTDLHYGSAAYVGSLDRAEGQTNRYISPTSPHFDQQKGLFKGFPRTYISAGGLETLRDDSTVVAEKLKADGLDVTIYVHPEATHDYILSPWHEPDRTEGLKKIGEWVDNQ